MAHTKAAGSTHLGRDSQPKYLGIKLFSGQKTKIGSVLVRQRGTKFFPGKNVQRGGDDTLYSLVNGVVKFSAKAMKKFNNSRRLTKIVNVIPEK